MSSDEIRQTGEWLHDPDAFEGRDYTGTWDAIAECGWRQDELPRYRDAHEALDRHARQAHPDAWALVEPVKAYALEHYNDGGWDVVVECWSDVQIAELIASSGFTTLEDVVRHSVLAACVDVWADQQADARNSAF